MNKIKLSSRGKRKVVRKRINDHNEDLSTSGETDAEDDIQPVVEEETAQAKRLRLAKQYIQNLETEERIKSENALIDKAEKDPLSQRLEEESLSQSGRLQKYIADKLSPNLSQQKILGRHKLPLTCLVITKDDRNVISASKDGSIIKWNVETSKMVQRIDGMSKSKSTQSNTKGHIGQVLALAISSDSKFLASAGHDTVINIWDVESMKWLHTFKGHRSTISGLVFRENHHQLFSTSHDKTIKIWDLDEMAYVETLYGHEDAVLGVDGLLRNCVVTCGGRDKSVRVWNIPEESQLVFQSPKCSSIDCITALNDQYFLAGGDDGSLSIFFTRKKKPVTVQLHAHSKTDQSPGGSCNESWLTSLSSLPSTDLAVTGSSDGFVKLWKCEKSFKSLSLIHSIPLNGFINALEFSHNGKFLVVGVGQEHRLGRWWKMKGVKNAVYIIPLTYDDINIMQ